MSLEANLADLGKIGIIGMIALLQSVTVVSAQTINPATTIEQLNAQRLEELATTIPQSGPVVISPAAAPRQLAAPGGPTVLLAKVDFSPASAFLTQADLDSILSRYVGHRVDFSQIQQLVQDVNDLYTRKGVVTASAVLPPQTLNNGILKVQLVEGTLATVAMSGNKQVPDTFVLERVRLTTGNNTVDVPTAAEDITRFNKVYNAQLRMSLQPGLEFGTTDLALELTEPMTNQLSFFFDNQGVPSTGEVQVGFFFHRYSLLTTDDNFLAYGTAAGGSTSGTLSYDAPITPMGTRLGLTYSSSAINVISGPTEPLNIEGSSESFSATLTHPLYVSPAWSLFVIAGASYGTSDSFSNATPLVDSATVKRSLALNASYTNQNMAFSTGLNVSRAGTEDFIEASARDVTLWTGSFNGTYQLESGIALTTNGAWQYTDAKLLPGDLLFQIGGPSTVRGFPSSASSGDSGYFAQFEAHKSVDADGWAKGIDVYGFIDIGEVYSTFPEQVSFVSAGAGVAYPLDEKAKFEIGVGFPLNKVVANQAEAMVYARLTFAAF
ncbi:ShlB/FhaC/HecB family hemolysin secretion/activation protein [Candidatus Halocynthiibacter alkanivorans]|uniref:ShlB/FhaC/HecB family hemolysin secretion/activation protein n=1 Tax=Candidatus Halocynthiibacter alkanivorans TaxID=2267619 RepID=UPI000DF15DE4|nr:ShlB/FhaC/HecB family hemolysin secretion/activation protein [Candidatus Halocynthiibacter alkanivorans]